LSIFSSRRSPRGALPRRLIGSCALDAVQGDQGSPQQGETGDDGTADGHSSYKDILCSYAGQPRATGVALSSAP
jgi:hypothetical protein